MTQTLALLLDSYRELNAKRLFWIVLVISALVVIGFAMIGIKGDTITVLWWETPFRANALSLLDPASLYKSMFTVFGVGFWLSWIGNILALASTAGVFPDFIQAGSIDLYLSKPISRLHLFLSKFCGGMVFVTLQVTVFSTCCFVVLGIRGHEWNPVIFLSIPIVVLTFSYLFSICVLLGVMTRSTIAALLLTLLLWFCIWGVQATETGLLWGTVQEDVHAASLDRQIADTRASIQRGGLQPTSAPTGNSSKNPFGYFSHANSRDDLQSRLDQLTTERQGISRGVYKYHNGAYIALTVLPKTSGTTELLTRALSDKEESDAADAFAEERDNRPNRRVSFADRKAVRKAVAEEQSKRTALWTIGTSVGFEVVMVSLAAWFFCRRDY